MHLLKFCLLMVYQIILENYFKAKKYFKELTIILVINSFLDFRKSYAYKIEICNSLKKKIVKNACLCIIVVLVSNNSCTGFDFSQRLRKC